MKRATLLMIMMGLILALAAGVAVAKSFTGDGGPDTISGTRDNDVMRGLGGNDHLYGRGANDRIYGGNGTDEIVGGPGDDPILNGGKQGDLIKGNVGGDSLYGASGDDTLRTVGDTQRDFVNCGPGLDEAHVSGNDVIDETRAGGLTTTTGLSCEVIFVDGFRIPRI